MTFAQRAIEVTFALGNGASFNTPGDNVVTLTGHRVKTRITAVAGPASGQANIRVYGLQPSILNKLAALNGAAATAQSNRVIVKAGNAGEVPAIVFDGQIVLAQSDMTQQPQTALEITANGGALGSVMPTPPSTYPGTADAAVILQNLATIMGLSFENSGASKILSTPYFKGDAKSQAIACANAAGFEITFDQNTLAIWPKGKVRGGSIPLISPDSGLVGYPTYVAMTEGSGLFVTTIFNPQLRTGGAVQIKSSLPYANGKWGVFYLTHQLESEVPNGQWITQFTARSYE